MGGNPQSSPSFRFSFDDVCLSTLYRTGHGPGHHQPHIPEHRYCRRPGGGRWCPTSQSASPLSRYLPSPHWSPPLPHVNRRPLDRNRRVGREVNSPYHCLDRCVPPTPSAMLRSSSVLSSTCVTSCCSISRRPTPRRSANYAPIAWLRPGTTRSRKSSFRHSRIGSTRTTH